MIRTKSKTYFKHLAAILLGALLVAPQLASAALSISQVPLFITIALPPNITVLLDDSGSMTWGHVPDDLGYNLPAAVNVVTTTTSSATVIVTAGSTTTASVVIGGSSRHWTFSCPTGYTESSPWTGTSSSSSTPSVPSGDTCTQTTYTYSCPTGYTLSGPTSGTSSSGSGTTCGKTTTTSTYKAFSSVYTPDTWHYKSAAYDPLSYNPSLSYSAGYSDTGTQLSTSFTAAYVNPYVTSASTVNLSTSYMATIDYDPSTIAYDPSNSANGGTSLMGQSASAPNTFQCKSSGLCTQDEVNACLNFSSSGVCNTGANFTPAPAFYYSYTPTSTSAVANNCGYHLHQRRQYCDCTRAAG